MDLIQIISEAFASVLAQMIGVFPRLFGALVLLFLGWLLARVFSTVLKKFLIRIGVEKLAEKLNASPAFRDSNITLKPADLLAQFVYWTLLLLFIMSAAETLELNVVSEQISLLIQYIPRLLTAFLILGAGFYAAGLAREGVNRAAKSFGLPAWRFLGGLVFYLLFIIVGVTALEQAGIDTSVIRANVTIIIGGIFLAFAIAYGFAARDVLSSILTSFYSRSNFEVGQTIEIEGVKGRIVRMDTISLVVDSGSHVTVFPLNRLHSGQVVIFKEGSAGDKTLNPS
jgi:small-conductance mechanosensitive channel